MKFGFLIVGMALLALAFQPALADAEHPNEHFNEYTGEWVPDFANGYKPISNYEMLSLGGQPTAVVYLFEADMALKAGKYEDAIAICKKSLALNDEDADTHVIYAQALETKMKAAPKRDPKLFNKVVKEWLIVMRDERGAEKGNYWHGFNARGNYYDDEDHALLAAQHLQKLTKVVPKNGVSDEKYLKQVLKPTTTEVKGKILNLKVGSALGTAVAAEVDKAEAERAALEKADSEKDEDEAVKPKKKKKSKGPPTDSYDDD